MNINISSVAKYEQTTQEAPASVTIISKEDIRNYGYNDIGELLNSVRDLYLSNDRNYTYLGIRGYGRPTDYNNRFAVMVNGVVINENIWGGGPIGTEIFGLNIDDVDRVEIIRGPASALYGNFPMMGMINIIMTSGKSWVGTKASVEYGSYGKLQSSVAYGKVFKNGLDINLAGRIGKIDGQDLYYAEYDDSATNFGVANKLDGSKYAGINGQITYRNFSFKGLLTWRDISVPTAAYESNFGDPKFQTIDRNSFGELQYSKDISPKVSVLGRSWLNSYKFDGEYPYDSADGGLLTEIGNGVWGGVEGRIRWDILANNRLMVGVEGQNHFKAQYYLDYDGEVEFDESYPFYTFGAYVQDEYQPFKKLSITAGGRFDRLYLGKIALTPRLAANFFASDKTTFKALYGEAFRAPTIYEATVGAEPETFANPDLKPERVRNLELVVEQRLGRRMFAVASVYSNRLSNLVDQEAISDSTYQFDNIQNVGGYGTSVELNGRFKNGLSFYSSYSFSFMRNFEDDSWLTNSPQHLAKGGINIPFWKHFRIAPEFVAESSRLTVYDKETTPFLLANVNFVFAPKFDERARFANRFQLSIKLRNILDTDYRYPGGYEHIQPAIQQNGRNVNIKLQVSLD